MRGLAISSPGWAAREREDLATLATVGAAVPLTWVLLLGWTWPRGIAGHDAVAHDLLIVREVAEGHGWSALTFRPDLLGGFKGASVLGPFPLFSLLADLGLSANAILTASAFLVQIGLGFLACRAAADVAVGWSDGARRLTWLERLGAAWLSAFAPVLAWRLGHGHLNLVAGLLPFAAALALIVATAECSITATLIALATAALVLGVLTSGQQIVVCSVVFGGPVLLGLWISLGGAWRRLVGPVLTLAGAALLAAPGFWPMLAHARGSDAPRALGAVTVTYDYVTATAIDWFTSIPWTIAALPSGRPAGLHHEINYPVGPVLLLLVAAAPWRRARVLAAALGVTLIAILILSLDVAPLSRALLAVVPPLKSFRVPARALLPWLWVVSVLAIAALVNHLAARAPATEAPTTSRASRRRAARARPGWRLPIAWTLAALVGVTLWVLPSAAREVAAWSAAAAALALPRWRATRALPPALALLVLGVGSVAAFGERLLPFPDVGALLAEAGSIGDVVRRARPELASPLARVRLAFGIPAFATNTAFAAGLSSLEGYAVPTRRFATLFFALRGEPYESTAVFFSLPPADPAWPALRQLYDVAWEAALASRDRLTLTPLGPTAGPAWFSGSIEVARDLPALAAELRSRGERLRERVAEVMWLDGSDVLTTARPAIVPDARCRQSRVERVDAPRRAREVVVGVDTATACPLTVAMNFTEDLRAVAIFTGGEHRPLRVFPGYGALASVIVPAGAGEIRLRAEPPRLPWAHAWEALGLLACAAAVVLGVARDSRAGSDAG